MERGWLLVRALTAACSALLHRVVAMMMREEPPQIPLQWLRRRRQSRLGRGWLPVRLVAAACSALLPKVTVAMMMREEPPQVPL